MSNPESLQNLSSDIRKLYDKYEKGSLTQKQFKDSVKSKLGNKIPQDLDRKLNDVGVSFAGILKSVNQVIKQANSPDQAPNPVSRPNPYQSFHRYKRSYGLYPPPAKTDSIFGQTVDFSAMKDENRSTRNEIMSQSHRSPNIFASPNKLDDSRRFKNVPVAKFDLAKSPEDEMRHISNIYMERKKAAPISIQAVKTNGDIITWQSPSKPQAYHLSPKVERTKQVPEM